MQPTIKTIPHSPPKPKTANGCNPGSSVRNAKRKKSLKPWKSKIHRLKYKIKCRGKSKIHEHQFIK